MAKALITTPFPSTAEVARKLGLPDSRVRRVAALMGFGASAADGNLIVAFKKASKLGGMRSGAPKRRRR